jgi:hypothetical protein
MTNPAYIELVFENVESIILKPDRFLKLGFGPLVKNEDRHTKYDQFFTDEVLMRISYEDASELAYSPAKSDNPLGGYTQNPDSNHVVDRPNILGRLLLYSDLTHIYYIDENENEISSVIVPWSEEDESQNEYMTVTTEPGYVEVRVRKE